MAPPFGSSIEAIEPFEAIEAALVLFIPIEGRRCSPNNEERISLLNDSDPSPKMRTKKAKNPLTIDESIQSSFNRATEPILVTIPSSRSPTEYNFASMTSLEPGVALVAPVTSFASVASVASVASNRSMTKRFCYRIQ